MIRRVILGGVPMLGKFLMRWGVSLWIAATGFAAEPQPLHDWQMGELLMPDASGKRFARVEGKAAVETAPTRAMVFDGETTRLELPNKTAADLPKRAITIEMCVMMGNKLRWGGIVGFIQDNGKYEKGWLLGYENDRFSFAVASVGGPGRLTYLKSPKPFALGRWYHVAGVYDGAVMRLYVNGRQAAESKAQKGDIDYPPHAWYTIGAYRDDNENYLFKGKLHRLRVYAAALPAAVIQAHARTFESLTVQPLEFAAEPRLRFLPGGRARVRWDLAAPAACVLEYARKGESARIKAASKKTTNAHEVMLAGLRPKTAYTYRIRTSGPEGELLSKAYSFDTTFDYTRPPCPPARLTPSAETAAARRALAAAGLRRGLCVVYGLENGRLAYEIARQSNMVVVGVDDSPRRVAAARAFLCKQGVYGIQVSVRLTSDLTATPVPTGFADLAVSEAWLRGRRAGSPKEMQRLLRPDGGRLLLLAAKNGLDAAKRHAMEADMENAGFKAHESAKFLEWSRTRGPLPGAGAWTHEYGDAGNSTNSWDDLGGADSTDDLTVQWLGLPGADFGIDRNPRMPAPLANHGVLFHQGMNRLAAIDAWNGVILWSLEMPALRRVNMPHDCANWCLDDDTLYVVARDSVFLLDPWTGREKARLAVPPEPNGAACEWGYVGRVGKWLVGSRVPRGAPFTDYWGTFAWYDKLGKAQMKVCSRALFAFAASGKSPKPAWVVPGRSIINSTITLGASRVFYLESRNPALKKNATGRFGDELWKDLDMVCRDAATGKELWRRHAETAPGKVVIYMSWVPGYLVAMSSGDKSYHLYCYDPKTGARRWAAKHPWTRDNHGGHMQHPVLDRNTVYQEPYAYDLATGKRRERGIGRHEGCATYAGARNALIYRGQGRSIAMWSIPSGKVTHWAYLRPSCWLSTIAGGGMVLSPEGGGGCSCGNWLETSLGFAPRSLQPRRAK